jgi:hypothetical protein
MCCSGDEKGEATILSDQDNDFDVTSCSTRPLPPIRFFPSFLARSDPPQLYPRHWLHTTLVTDYTLSHPLRATL